MSQVLQALLDGPDQVIDLQGAAIDVGQVILTTAHNGKMLRNGTILCQPMPANLFGHFCFVRNQTWNGVTYPDGPISFEFEDLKFDGGFDAHWPMQDHNERQAALVSRECNAITTKTYGIEGLWVRGCSFERFGNSAIAVGAQYLLVEDCRFWRVAKHCVGVRGHSGNATELLNIWAGECGNAFDFHNDGIRRDDHTAVIDNLTCVDPRGRTKLNDSNLHISMNGMRFIQTDPFNLNPWPAIDIAQRPRHAGLTDFYLKNFWHHGIGSLFDSTEPDGDVYVADGTIEGSLSGMKIQMPFTVDNVNFIGCHHEYRSGGPIAQSGNITTRPWSNLDWAQRLDAVNRMKEVFNKETGTNYAMAYWKPNAVAELMETNKRG